MPAQYTGHGNKIPPAPGTGRPKGSLNKIGLQAKENIVEVFNQIGGIPKMVAWARRNKTEFYRMYARLIPSYVQASVNNRDASEFTDDELSLIVASASRSRAAIEEGGEEKSDSVH